MRHASEVMTTLGILERELRGDVISLTDPEYPKIAALITEAQQILAEMNTATAIRPRCARYSRA